MFWLVVFIRSNKVVLLATNVAGVFARTMRGKEFLFRAASVSSLRSVPELYIIVQRA